MINQYIKYPESTALTSQVKFDKEEHRKKANWPSYHEGNFFIFTLFLFYIVYWYLQGGVRFPFLGAIRFEFVLGAILSIFAILNYFSNSNRKKSGIGIWVIFLFIIMMVMTVFSFDPVVSYNIFIDRVVKFALLGFFIAAFVTSPNRLGFFIAAFMCACLKMGQEGLVGNITGGLIWQNQEIMRLHGATPNYEHPNSFAGMALGCIPFVLYFYKIVPRYLRIILLIQFGLMLHIIIFTGSRTGYFGLIGGTLFFLWQAQNRKRTLFIILFAILLIGPFVPEQYIKRAQTLTPEQEGGEQSGIFLRQQIQRDALHIFLQNPLGVGVSAFPSVRKHVFGRSQDTHNLYLEIATNLGIEGFIIFTGFIFSLIRLLSKLKENIANQIEQINKKLLLTEVDSYPDYIASHLYDLQLMLAAIKSVYLLIITRLFLGIFGHDLYEIYWWFALGTMIAVWNINIVSKRRTNMLISI